MPNIDHYEGSRPSNNGESIAIHGPGVRFMLDPAKDLEPQIREAIGAMEIENPSLKFGMVPAAEDRSAIARSKEGGGEAKP
jgi:hypothetical protein